MREINILITAAGKRVSLIKLFKKAIIDSGNYGKVFATDIVSHAPALYHADEYWISKNISDNDYIPNLLHLCLENSISIVIPTIDTELEKLSHARSLFSQNGIKIFISDASVISIFSNKRNTHKFFQKHEIPQPKLYELQEMQDYSPDIYPLIIKPSKGSSGEGVNIVRSYEELIFFYERTEDPIIQELIKGEEYTIDALIGIDGEVIQVIPRKRLQVRGGEVSKAMTVNNKEIINWCNRIFNFLSGARGCITLQCFIDTENRVKFIEVNPRFGGGFPLTAEAGGNYPLWLIQIYNNEFDQKNFKKKWNENLVMLRYDECIFLDKKNLIYDN